MIRTSPITRRRLLSGVAALAALVPARALAQIENGLGRGFVLGSDFGLVSNPPPAEGDRSPYDQSANMQAAVNAAAEAGLPLFLPGGSYVVGNIELPSWITIQGVRGATHLIAPGADPLLHALQKSRITLRDLRLEGAPGAAKTDNSGLLFFAGCEDIELDALNLRDGSGNGAYLDRTSGHVENLNVQGFGETGIFAIDSSHLDITGNRIFNCGNGGIRVWARESGGHDGTVVARNDIYDIRADGGGNGQNGNGINVFRADGVTLTGNRLRNCAFTAIRLNSTNDTIVSANTCLDSGEVAIFSEFAFAGSIISDNIVDGAAQGISITNFNQGGRLATCSGNIVRNIYPNSRVNPHTVPVGIFAEADALIAGNVVEVVPGVGIGAGWGPYLRDVSVTDNLVRDVEIGIAVSVAEGAGKAMISGNRIAGSRSAAIAGMAWQETISDDLLRDAEQFPNVTLSGNSVG
jgi:uncharacterized secreted repeat protein (TIGR03808 family)